MSMKPTPVRWTKRLAGGRVPRPISGFAAAHHRGTIYIVGGQRCIRTVEFSNEVIVCKALQLGCKACRHYVGTPIIQAPTCDTYI